MLREVHETYTEIEEIEILEDWVGKKVTSFPTQQLQRAIGEKAEVRS